MSVVRDTQISNGKCEFCELPKLGVTLIGNVLNWYKDNVEIKMANVHAVLYSKQNKSTE